MSDVHDLDPQAFLEEVHSFEFWFQAVEGYLSGTTWGHRPGTIDAPIMIAVMKSAPSATKKRPAATSAAAWSTGSTRSEDRRPMVSSRAQTHS